MGIYYGIFNSHYTYKLGIQGVTVELSHDTRRTVQHTTNNLHQTLTSSLLNIQQQFKAFKVVLDTDNITVH